MAEDTYQGCVTLKAGEQFTISLKKSVPLGCTFQVWINGRHIQPGETVGELRVVRLGAKGEVTLEPKTDSPNATIVIRIVCPNKPVNDKYHQLGVGWRPPRDEPPNPDAGREEPPDWFKDFAGSESQREGHH